MLLTNGTGVSSNLVGVWSTLGMCRLQVCCGSGIPMSQAPGACHGEASWQHPIADLRYTKAYLKWQWLTGWLACTTRSNFPRAGCLGFLEYICGIFGAPPHFYLEGGKHDASSSSTVPSGKPNSRRMPCNSHRAPQRLSKPSHVFQRCVSKKKRILHSYLQYAAAHPFRPLGSTSVSPQPSKISSLWKRLGVKGLSCQLLTEGHDVERWLKGCFWNFKLQEMRWLLVAKCFGRKLVQKWDVQLAAAPTATHLGIQS